MAKKIRFGRLTVGSSYAGMVNMSFDDAGDFDRKQADNEYYGTPVEVKRGGSGEVRTTEGSLPPYGYQTNDWVFLYEEVSVTAGVESVVEKTETFGVVTCQHSGSLPAGAVGELSAKFEYGTRVHA
jgi:hypothetical protein